MKSEPLRGSVGSLMRYNVAAMLRESHNKLSVKLFIVRRLQRRGVMRRTERNDPKPLTDQQIRSIAQTLCGEEYNPKKPNALLLLMDDIQRHADAGETGEVITASIITKQVAFSKLDTVMDIHIESLRNDT